MKSRNFTMFELLVVIFIVAILMAMLGGIFVGVGTGGWGPEKEWTVLIKDKYVDTESQSKNGRDSHYMVSTDQGIFEVNNGVLLKVWNADEIYGRLDRGKTYRIKTKGNKRVNWFMQEYPYIVAVLEGPIGESPTVSTSTKTSVNLDNMTMKEVQEWAKKNGVEVKISPSGSGPIVEK